MKVNVENLMIENRWFHLRYDVELLNRFDLQAHDRKKKAENAKEDGVLPILLSFRKNEMKNL